MMSKQEARCFLEDILKLSDVNDLLDSPNKRYVINTIIKAFINKMPFQNITLLATDPQDRHRPTWPEIKQDMFLRQGGLCYSLHIFAYALLKALSFDVDLAHSSVSSPDNHLVILLRNVETSEDLFLLDVGSGYPTFEIIPLGFEDESPIYKHSFLEYKFIKRGTEVWRMHEKGDQHGGGVGNWRKFCHFELKAVENLTEFDECFQTVYTEPTASPFHKSVRYVGFRDDKAEIVFNHRTLMENDQQELKTTDLLSEDDIVKRLLSFTDAFDESCIRKALKNWKNVDEQS